MAIRTVLVSIILLSLMTSGMGDENQQYLEYIIEYMRKNLSTYQVTVAVKSLKKLRPLTSHIVKRMVDEFSSVVIDTDSSYEDSSSMISEKLWNQTSDQSKLKIGIIDLQSFGTNELQELFDLLKFFTKYSPYIREKCLIFLLNRDSINLEPFLRFAWAKDYLDLTIVQWGQTLSRKTFIPIKNWKPNIVIHTLNSFKDIYSKKLLTKDSDLFPNKLKDLHGYHLYVEVHELANSVELMRNYTGLDPWGKVSGHDVFLTKLLAETFNFEAIPQIIQENVAGTISSLNRYVLSDESSMQPIDFYSNLIRLNHSDDSWRIKSNHIKFRNLSADYAPFPKLQKVSLIIFQRKVMETVISFSFVITVNVYLAIGVIFIIFPRILRLNCEIWSISNIAKTLLGGSIESQSRIRLPEKILLMNLYAVSFVMITLTQDELLEISLSQRQLLKFKTLQDIADSAVNLRVNNFTRQLLLKYGEHHPTLEKIATRSIITDDFDPYNESGLNADIDGAIYGYTGCNPHDIFPNVYNNDDIWFITTIEEHISMHLPVLVVRKNLPLRDSFETVLQKSFERGLMSGYAKIHLDHFFRLSLNQSSKNMEVQSHNTSENDKVIEMPLNDRLVIIISIGYLLSAVTLTSEIIIKKLKLNLSGWLQINFNRWNG
ncbi:hypothetical protein QAD02_011728 [Eretmocerus hayati]|uniref:Uncharacterized protein n=1 Tax=Eretmocerus hayati TaxID=131215 RepID=A0ACC2P0G7_9HYME|nr:hypothetical protein QAD02_011728 [Eretmocerus hayati]